MVIPEGRHGSFCKNHRDGFQPDSHGKRKYDPRNDHLLVTARHVSHAVAVLPFSVSSWKSYGVTLFANGNSQRLSFHHRKKAQFSLWDSLLPCKVEKGGYRRLMRPVPFLRKDSPLIGW